MYLKEPEYTYKVTSDQLTETTGPVAEPVSVPEMKLHLRVDFSEDDTLIAAQIKAVRQWMEDYLQIAMVPRTYLAKFERLGEVVELPIRPIASVSQIQVYSTDSPSVLTTVDASLYDVDTNKGRIYRAHAESWPDWYPRPDAVQVTFVAGYDGTSPVVDATPESLKAALKLIVGDLYENRENFSIMGGKGGATGEQIRNLPTARMLMDTYRVYR